MSNIQAMNKYRRVSEKIDALINELILKEGMTVKNAADSLFLTKLEVLKDQATDISISFQDKANENT